MSTDFPIFTKTFHSSVYPAIDPTKDELSVNGKVVLITGGSRGIGKAIAFAFATAGARAIALLGRTATTLEDVAKELSGTSEKSGHRAAVRFFAVDVSNTSVVSKAFESVQKEFGHIDIVINNAGDLYMSTINDCDPSAYWHSFEINVKGTLNCMQALLLFGRGDDSKRSTTFINVSTIGITMQAFPGWSAYAASKLAAFNMVEYLRIEAGEKCRVFSINPGRIATDMAAKAGIPTFDDPELPGAFCVWLASSSGADFLQGRLVSCNWDVDELLEMKEQILEEDLLKMKLCGLKA